MCARNNPSCSERRNLTKTDCHACMQVATSQPFNTFVELEDEHRRTSIDVDVFASMACCDLDLISDLQNLAWFSEATE